MWDSVIPNEASPVGPFCSYVILTDVYCPYGSLLWARDVPRMHHLWECAVPMEASPMRLCCSYIILMYGALFFSMEASCVVFAVLMEASCVGLCSFKEVLTCEL